MPVSPVRCSFVMAGTLFLAIGQTGCKSKSEVVFDDFAPILLAAQKSTKAEFYTEAALEAASVGADDIFRPNVVGTRRAALLKNLAPAMRKIAQGTQSEGSFVFTPTGPFDSRREYPGWSLLSRSFAWKIEDAVRAKDFGAAIQIFLTATQFGFDLCGGGAIDASMGATVINRVRKALLPCLPELNPGQLGSIRSGLAAILSRRPDTARMLKNEEQNMLMAVQMVQDAYRKQSFAQLETSMQSGSKGLIEALKTLKNEKPETAPDYFRALAREARTETNELIARAKEPASRRTPMPELKAAGRPWWVVARTFLRTGRSALGPQDEVLARTRLLIVWCWARAQASSGSAPTALAKELGDNTMDPYTGSAFPYRASGSEFEVYSLGADGRDNGGESNESHSEPDLTLEIEE
ncbi:MAG: hypothetical protein JST40_02705 [Armatimonadetes bacterium]|nr:hypothetical protein [Armatimonadota bacterium]